MIRIRACLLIGLVILAGISILTCCDDCPTCPTDPVPGSYYVYFADDNDLDSSYVWIADSATDSIIDSIPIPVFAYRMNISPNGQYIAVTFSFDSIFVYNVDTKESISKIGDVETVDAIRPYFSLDNQFLVYSGYGSGSLLKYNVQSGNLVKHDTLSYDLMGQTSISPYVYGLVNNNEYFIYDYEHMEIVARDTLWGLDGNLTKALTYMIMSPDEQYCYFMVYPNQIYKYDLSVDLIVDSLYLRYGAYFGEMVCSPDGRYLVVAEVLDMMEYPLGTLAVFDLSNFGSVQRIGTWDINPNYPATPMYLGYLAITPDGCKAYSVTYWIGALPPVSFNLVDYSAGLINGMRDKYSPGDVVVGREIKK